MQVSKVMSRKLITLDIDDTLQKAKSMFDQYSFHHLLIVENKKLIGVINDSDLYKNLSPAAGTRKETADDISQLKKKVHLIMNRSLITANEHISLIEAVTLFHHHHISCLPIVDDNSYPIGIITWRDIFKIMVLQQEYKDKQSMSN